MEGVDEKADLLSDGVISADDSSVYVSDRVKKLTNGEQMPTTAKPDMMPDLRLFVVPQEVC